MYKLKNVFRKSRTHSQDFYHQNFDKNKQICLIRAIHMCNFVD